MSNTFGKNLKVTIFGQSHSEAIGAVIDCFPAGFTPDMDKVRAFMERRAPGRSLTSTARYETDEAHVVSGLVNGKTCGAPICAVIYNKDCRSEDYTDILNIPRPSHADYSAFVKYKGENDIRGGGQFSGRLTAPLCFAGALCLQLLEQKGIYIGAQILEIGSLRDTPPDSMQITPADLSEIRAKNMPVFNENVIKPIKKVIETARTESDSVGGIIRAYALGVPPGLGSPMFEGVENRLAQGIFAIPAVKALSFGDGFDAARMKGSEHNDPFLLSSEKITAKANHHGGILGGITSGAPIVMDVAIKPTPSIAREQDSVNLGTMENVKLSIKGRHDPCIVPRAVPAVEAVMAITILDMMLENN